MDQAWETVGAGKKSSKPKKKKGTAPSGSAASSTPSSTAPASTPSVGTAARASMNSTNSFAAIASDDDDDDGGFGARDIGIGSPSYASAVSGKPKSNVSLYPSSASHVASSSASIPPPSSVLMAIADSGATHHMWPEYSAFTSYRPLTNESVTLADDTQAPVAGIGSVKILFDGKVIDMRDVLHVPSLRLPLYSLRVHRKMKGCGFIGDNARFHVYFPGFVATVADDVDSYVAYSPLGKQSTLPYDFLQPRTPSSTARVSSSPLRRPPTLQASTMPSPSYDAEFPPLPSSSTSAVPTTKPPSSSPLVKNVSWSKDLVHFQSDSPTHPLPVTSPVTGLLKTPRITKDSLLAFLPHGRTDPAPIRPCDTPNGSDTTRHLTADQIYRLFGNRRFRNYSNFCLAAKDSKFIKGGEPVPSLGEFATIPKCAKGLAIPRPTRALEKVHIDIAFGDGLGKLGFRYALIFVDRATRYIWVFGLKSLHADALIEAFTAFRAEAGCLATHFRTDCDAKLLSHQVGTWLRSQGSDIASAPAGRQSSNGLVERNWRTMVKMARSYLTEKQMPRSFWFRRFNIRHE